jgi:sporulation protein YlmC with PRC-barrel domain
MKCRELIGKEVVDAEAKMIGYVKDLDIDLKKWNVIGIVVKTGFIKKTSVLVSDIDKVGDKVMLKVPAGKIQKA